MRRVLGRLNVFRRLREAEATIEALQAQQDEHTRALLQVTACFDCGAVQAIGHPAVGKTRVEPEGQPAAIVIRCQFHQKVFEERSARVVKMSERRRNGIIVPGA